METRKRRLIIAGGGTGGHVLAGVAVADAWKGRFPGAEITFVGAQGMIEEKLVPRAGYPLELLKLGSLNRVSLAQRVKTVFRLPMSFLRSAAILLRKRPDAVLGVGGYASGPLVLVAKLLSIFRVIRARTAILEQNSVPGMTNRILGRWVDEVYCTFPGTEKQFGGARARITGNPVRSAMKRLPPASRDPFTIFIFGGSLGAVGINTLVVDALPALNDVKDRLRFIHQTGEKDYERVLEGHRAAGTDARVEKFIHDMASCYAQASLLICRSGSSTMAEVAAVGRAAIFVPFPFASDNHQEKNARVYSESGAALLLVQSQATGLDLARLIRKLMQDPAQLEQMENAVVSYYKPKAASDIVDALSGSHGTT